MKLPPLLPEETLHRVVRVANVDGLSVMAFAGMFALASASVRDVEGTCVALLVAAAGAIELHGVGLVRAGEARGMRWVIASQPYMMTVLLAFCAWRLWLPEIPPPPKELVPMLTESAGQFGNTLEEHVEMLYRLTYRVLAFVTLAYQGAMTIYYLRRREAVEEALAFGSAPEE